MTAYRIFVLDNNGHITGPPIVIECETEAEAIENANQYVDGRVLELWNGARLVRRFEKKD